MIFNSWFRQTSFNSCCLQNQVFRSFLILARYVPNVAKKSIWNQCNIKNRPTDQRPTSSWKNFKRPYLHNCARWTHGQWSQWTTHKKSTAGRESNGHVTDDVTWPQKVNVVTPLSLRRHISITVPDRRMRWGITSQFLLGTSVINHYWKFFFFQLLKSVNISWTSGRQFLITTSTPVIISIILTGSQLNVGSLIQAEKNEKALRRI